MHEHHVTRRHFMRETAGTAAAVGASLVGLDHLEALGRQAPRPPRAAAVTVVRDRLALAASHDVDRAVLARMVSDTVMRTTGTQTPKAAWQALVKPTDVVGLVSTNHLNPTHPEIVDVVRQSLVDAGVPERNVVSGNGRIDAARRCTALIALPALKAHWLTGIGTVLKNYILFSGNPSRYHDANNAGLGEIWNLPDVKGKTRLVLVDALRPLCDKGPQVDPRYLWDYKGLIAGTDPVAVETIALAIILEKRQQLRGEPWPLSPPPLCVTAADQVYGLGTSRRSEIKLNVVGWEEAVLLRG